MSTTKKNASSQELEELLQELEKKTDLELRIQLTLRSMADCLPDKLKFQGKNSEKSIALRNEADKLVFDEKGRLSAFLKAWALYCESIAIAETSSSELAQAYANRSAILFNLRKQRECVRDINRALENNYPDHLKANLIRRKAKCLKILGHSDAEKVCEEARSWLEKMNLNEQKKERIDSKINHILKDPELPKLCGDHEEESILKSPQELMSSNKKIPAACDAIDIKYNRDFGKHLIANRDIDIGEILIVEKPYAKSLNKDFIYTHCSNCFQRAWDSIPCDYCSYAMYCSEICKDDAWKQYHDIECLIKKHFMTVCVNDFGPLSLRLTIQAVREHGGIDELRRQLEKIDNRKDYLLKSLSENRIYESDKYRSVYNFETHENDIKRSDILSLSLNTTMILYSLYMQTTFIDNNPHRNLTTLLENKDALFIGKLIALNYMKAEFNSQEFFEIQDDFVRIGALIGPTIGLLNHSCNPNISRFPMLKNRTVQQVVYALHPIKKGSQLFDDYGCHFSFTAKSKRDEFLSKYFFKCNCEACNNETWPKFEQLPSILSLVTEKEKRLAIARALVRAKEYQEIVFERGLSQYRGDKLNLLRYLGEKVSLIFNVTDKPNRELSELLEQYKQTFVQVYGYKFDKSEFSCLK